MTTQHTASRRLGIVIAAICQCASWAVWAQDTAQPNSPTKNQAADKPTAETAASSPATPAKTPTTETTPTPPETPSAEPQSASPTSAADAGEAARPPTPKPTPESTPPPAQTEPAAPPSIVAPAPIATRLEPTAPPSPLGQKRNGFALELFFGINRPLIAMDDDFFDFSMLGGGLFLGGKINRIIVGLGFDISRVTYRRKYETTAIRVYGGDTSTGYAESVSETEEYKASVTKFVFKPGVRFVMVQSKDQKVDMFGQIDLGAGTLIEKYDSDSTDYYDYYYDSEDDKYFIGEWDGALGVRYWAHPQFAVSAKGGVNGTFLHVKDGDSESTYSYHVMGISGGLQLLGVF